jgi:hypothetical protein
MLRDFGGWQLSFIDSLFVDLAGEASNHSERI